MTFSVKTTMTFNTKFLSLFIYFRRKMYDGFNTMYDDVKFDGLEIEADYKGVTLDDIKMVYDIFGGRIDSKDKEIIKRCDNVVESLGLDHLRDKYLYLSREFLSSNIQKTYNESH
jgi:hypothetical protein